MRPSGKGRRPFLFVSEAPGETEDARGTQLVGPSGQRLREELDKLDVRLDDCRKTQAVICRPPTTKILPKHVDSCRPNLLRTIREDEPHVIILLGGASVKSLMPTTRDDKVGGISRWVGWKIPSFQYKAWICPTYHPSYILRMDNPVLNLLFHNHLRDAIALEKAPIPGADVATLLAGVEVVASPREARRRLAALAVREGTLAFDYETTGLKPDREGHRIVACSFCLDGANPWSFLVDETHHKGLRAVLSSPHLRKIASNMKHEERWTRKMLGIPVVRWFHDCVLGAHVFDNRRGVSGLKFQAFILFGIADYNGVVSQFFVEDESGFNQIDDCPVHDLLKYNGLDSLLAYMVAERQREAMGFGW